MLNYWPVASQVYDRRRPSVEKLAGLRCKFDICGENCQAIGLRVCVTGLTKRRRAVKRLVDMFDRFDMGGDQAVMGRRSPGVYLRHVEHSRLYHQLFVHRHIHITASSLSEGNPLMLCVSVWCLYECVAFCYGVLCIVMLV